ncbi:MAG: hypothetical protein FIB05_17520, partial [Betaproteobacteria bacterium]|nr:hypothetical protein [Betaproteobacteria bacterium]
EIEALLEKNNQQLAFEPMDYGPLFGVAAGRGTRLGGLTQDIPKPLLEVGGRPIIFRILEGLAGAGVRDVTVITGHLADVLETALGVGGRWGLALRCARQGRLDGTATATALARPFLRDSPFFVWGGGYGGGGRYS